MATSDSASPITGRRATAASDSRSPITRGREQHRRPGARSCNTGRRGVDAARGHSPPQDAGVSTPLVDTRPGVSIALRAPLLFTVMADARGCRA